MHRHQLSLFLLVRQGIETTLCSVLICGKASISHVPRSHWGRSYSFKLQMDARWRWPTWVPNIC